MSVGCCTRWERPWYNVWVLWVLSHVCLYPAKWMLVMTLLATVWLCRGAAIRVSDTPGDKPDDIK